MAWGSERDVREVGGWVVLMCCIILTRGVALICSSNSRKVSLTWLYQEICEIFLSEKRKWGITLHKGLDIKYNSTLGLWFKGKQTQSFRLNCINLGITKVSEGLLVYQHWQGTGGGVKTNPPTALSHYHELHHHYAANTNIKKQSGLAEKAQAYNVSQCPGEKNKNKTKNK